jgi:hypothetical protein
VIIGISSTNDSNKTNQKASVIDVKQNKDAFFKYLYGFLSNQANITLFSEKSKCYREVDWGKGI